MSASSNGRPFQPNHPTEKTQEIWKILKILFKGTKDPRKRQDLRERRRPSGETQIWYHFSPLGPLLIQKG